MNVWYRDGERALSQPAGCKAGRAWTHQPPSCCRAPSRRAGRPATASGTSRSYGLSGLASLFALVLIGAIVYKIVDGAWPSIQQFGLSFVWDQTWDPNRDIYGALDFIYGTALTSAVALLFAAPISIGIGLYLSELAPAGVRGVVGSLIEMLAAVPSVIIGLWGILVLGPFVQKDLEPFLGSFLGWTPFFSGSVHTGGVSAGDDRADDHDRPDQLVGLPRALPDRAAGAEGGRVRPRADPLGDGARRGPARTRAAASSARSCSASAARSARRSRSRR